MFIYKIRKQLNNLNQTEQSTIYDIEILKNLKHCINDEIRTLKYEHYYLPNQIILEILSYVTIKKLFKNIALVCKRWNSIAMNEKIGLKKRILYFFIHQYKIVYPEYRKIFERNIRQLGILWFIKKRIIERYSKKFEGFYQFSYESQGFKVKGFDSESGFKRIIKMFLINRYGHILFIQSMSVYIGEVNPNNDFCIRSFTFSKYDIINDDYDYKFFKDSISLGHALRFIEQLIEKRPNNKIYIESLVPPHHIIYFIEKFLNSKDPISDDLISKELKKIQYKYNRNISGQNSNETLRIIFESIINRSYKQLLEQEKQKGYFIDQGAFSSKNSKIQKRRIIQF